MSDTDEIPIITRRHRQVSAATAAAVAAGTLLAGGASAVPIYRYTVGEPVCAPDVQLERRVGGLEERMRQAELEGRTFLVEQRANTAAIVRLEGELRTGFTALREQLSSRRR
jgi:hypothetical protein